VTLKEKLFDVNFLFGKKAMKMLKMPFAQ